MPEHTFLSYSRREYFFAESLALNLQHVGLSVWFDIQQLEPGIDWKADIDAGIQRSQSLTLVASRAALASPYVRAEWQAALSLGKPIYVALFEGVRLPRELRDRARIVDFRGDFDRSLRELADCLSGADRRVPRIFPAILPRYSPGVARTAWALNLYDIQNHIAMAVIVILTLTLLVTGSFARRLIEMGFLELVNVDVSLVFDFVLVGFLVVALLTYLRGIRYHWDALRFLRRRFDYDTLVTHASTKVSYGLLWWLTGMYAAQTLIPLTDLAVRTELPAAPLFRPVNAVVPVATIIVLGVIGWMARKVMPSHPVPDVVRWVADFDAVSPEWRKLVSGGLTYFQSPRLPPAPAPTADTQPAVAVPPVQPTTGTTVPVFSILAAPGDQAEAHQLSDVLHNLNYGVAANNRPATHTALILSFRTPRALLQDALQRPNLIGIVSTDIRLPKDLPRLTDTQLVDVREGGPSEAVDFMRYLSSGSEAMRARFSLSVLPVNLAPTRRDRVLDSYRADVIGVAGTFIGTLLYVALRLLLHASNAPGVYQIPLPTVVSGALLLVLGLLILTFTWGMRRGWRLYPRIVLNFLMLLGVALLPVFDVSVGDLGQTIVFPSVGAVQLVPLTTIAIFTLGAYRVLRVIRGLGKRPDLLVPPGADVLGMPPLNVNLGGFLLALTLPTIVVMGVLLTLNAE